MTNTAIRVLIRAVDLAAAFLAARWIAGLFPDRGMIWLRERLRRIRGTSCGAGAGEGNRVGAEAAEETGLAGYPAWLRKGWQKTLRMIDRAGWPAGILRDPFFFGALCLVSDGIAFGAARMAGFPALPAMMLGLAGLGIPYMAMDIRGRYRTDQIRDKLADFLSVLSRWCHIQEDILYALEKSARAGIGEPLGSYVEEACQRIRGGMPIDRALILLENRVDHPFFRDLILNIRQTVKSRGDIKGLMVRMESQYYKIKAELDRRDIRTYRDRLLVYSMMALAPLCGGWFLSANGPAGEFYLSHPTGRLLLTGLTFLYILGILLSLRMTKRLQ